MKARLLVIAMSFALVCGAEELRNDEALKLVIAADRLVYPLEYESRIAITDSRPGRAPTTERGQVYRRDDKMLLVFSDPPIQKGEAFIRSGDDMWLYLPRSKKVMRIGAKESSMGGEASNADILRVDLARDYLVVSAALEDVPGAMAWRIELKAKDRTIAYDKLVMWIDRESRIPLKREYYTLSGRRLKTMTFSKVQKLGGRTMPTLISIVNEENSAYRTDIIVEAMKEGLALGNQIFSPSYVQQGLLR